MRRITCFVAALGLGLAADALGQSGFSGGGSSFGGGGSSFGGGGSSFGGGGSSFGGGGSFSGGSSFSGGGTGFSGGTGSTGPTRTGASGRPIGGSGVSISPTNFLAATYANPMALGSPMAMGNRGGFGSQATAFGQPSFGTVNITSVQTAGRGTAAGRAGTAGRSGTATVGGFTGGAIGGRSPITYAIVVAPTPSESTSSATPAVNSRLRAELQGLLSRTTAIRQPAAITVEVVGSTVVLRGRVTDEDERRLVEGMIALEPGVHEVHNELEVR